MALGLYSWSILGNRFSSEELGTFLRSDVVGLTTSPFYSPSTTSRGYCGPILTPVHRGDYSLIIKMIVAGVTKIFIVN